MPRYKAIATITWMFDSNTNSEKALELSKTQLDKILESSPHGEDYQGFNIFMDISQMKDRKRMKHLASFSLEEVLPYITSHLSKKTYHVGNKSYEVRMNSQRYFVFKSSPFCASCGVEGVKMILDLNYGDLSPHFNLYAEENGRLLLMSKDHIIPKSKGGADKLDNYVTMCSVCNNLKGDYELTLQECRRLREIYNNENKLPRKKIKELIHGMREKAK